MSDWTGIKTSKLVFSDITIGSFLNVCILICILIIKNVTSKKVEYGDIFKETDKQKQTIEHFQKI